MKILLLLLFGFSLCCFSQNKITKIEFSTNGYASEPDFDIVIYKDKTAIFIAKKNNYRKKINGDIVAFGTNENGISIKNSEVKGVFKVKLKKSVYNEVIKLVSALKDEFKKGFFTSNQIHNSEAKLTILTEKHKVISIQDIGMNNNINLTKVYNYFKELRFNQNWK